jgi:hypothetical protein
MLVKKNIGVGKPAGSPVYVNPNLPSLMYLTALILIPK